MNTKLCVRLGIVSGGFVGVLLSLLRAFTICCGVPVFPPTFARLALDGVVVALLTMFLAVAFTCLVTHLPVGPIALLGFYIAIVTGVLLGPPAYHIHNPGLALILCAILGALLGWLICRIICGIVPLKPGVAQ